MGLEEASVIKCKDPKVALSIRSLVLLELGKGLITFFKPIRESVVIPTILSRICACPGFNLILEVLDNDQQRALRAELFRVAIISAPTHS